jgi:hypothetical protein
LHDVPTSRLRKSRRSWREHLLAQRHSFRTSQLYVGYWPILLQKSRVEAARTYIVSSGAVVVAAFLVLRLYLTLTVRMQWTPVVVER